jgi:hypothetical protein
MQAARSLRPDSEPRADELELQLEVHHGIELTLMLPVAESPVTASESPAGRITDEPESWARARAGGPGACHSPSHGDGPGHGNGVTIN